MQRQPSRGGTIPIRYRAAGAILLAAHLLFVSWITLRPLDVPWVSPANLHLLAGIRADLALGPGEAVRRIGSGMLLLAPLGVLLPLTGGRLTASPLGSLVRTVTAATLLSIAIELLQTGVPGQVVDVDALLLNPLGVALLHLAVVPAARARLRRRAGIRGPRSCRRGLSEDGADGRPDAFPDGLPEPFSGLSAGPAGGLTGGSPEDASQGTTPTIARVRIAP
ncbi:VanZ family protein [Streptomyces sp. TS71-3]|uniref:VanZ family protein n=1 Tax=Streptomyces sp. TS71-3 TaxID=2733862 RepID=UPI001BB2F2A9|nr:VanZ family protein [Streptomyces sp. TS71-3]